MTFNLNDSGRQHLKQFAPGDWRSLLNVPEMEQRYRLLRNEWLTLHSRLKQCQERVAQAVRRRNADDIADARAREAAVSVASGVMKRMAIIARARAEAEAFVAVAEKMLPREVYKALNDARDDLIQRPAGNFAEVRLHEGHSRLSVDDYATFDELIKRWGKPADAEADSNEPYAWMERP